MKKPVVGVVMGSNSDWKIMSHAVEQLKELGIPHEARVVSAHRTPDLLYEYAEQAEQRGLRCIIAGAGGAAHLPGMVASLTPLPVIGVPVSCSWRPARSRRGSPGLRAACRRRAAGRSHPRRR